MRRRNVGVLLFDRVEVLEFSGPYEVFAVANRLSDTELFDLHTVSYSGEPLRAYGGLQLIPDFAMHDCPPLDVIIVPGGDGSKEVMQVEEALNWIVHRAEQAEKVMSVCSGALILAKGGLLDDLQGTTHHRLCRALEQLAPKTAIIREARFVDNGRIMTTAGIASGIDGALEILYELHGQETCEAVARFMEHNWNREGAVTSTNRVSEKSRALQPS